MCVCVRVRVSWNTFLQWLLFGSSMVEMLTLMAMSLVPTLVTRYNPWILLGILMVKVGW